MSPFWGIVFILIFGIVINIIGLYFLERGMERDREERTKREERYRRQGPFFPELEEFQKLHRLKRYATKKPSKNKNPD